MWDTWQIDNLTVTIKPYISLIISISSLSNNSVFFFAPPPPLSHSPSRIVRRLWNFWWWRSSRKVGFSCFSRDWDPFYGFGWWFKVLAIDGLCLVLENLGRLWLWSLYCFRRMGKWEGTVTSLFSFIFYPIEYWIPHPWAWIGFSISVQQKTPWIVKPIIPYIFHWIYHNFVIWKEYISKLGIFIKKLINQCGPLRFYFCSVCVWRDLFLGGRSDYFLLRPLVHGIVGEHSPSIFFPSTPVDLILAPSGSVVNWLC